jgi:hypothetical protein
MQPPLPTILPIRQPLHQPQFPPAGSRQRQQQRAASVNTTAVAVVGGKTAVCHRLRHRLRLLPQPRQQGCLEEKGGNGRLSRYNPWCFMLHNHYIHHVPIPICPCVARLRAMHVNNQQFPI